MSWFEIKTLEFISLSLAFIYLSINIFWEWANLFTVVDTEHIGLCKTRISQLVSKAYAAIGNYINL
jgi:hypothetical protein